MASEWQPISEERIWGKINEAWPRMNFAQRRIWEIVKISPEKWANQTPGYDHGAWVIAIIGKTVIWYDDIEEGFRLSHWITYGVVDGNYWMAETSLETQLQTVLTYFNPSFATLPTEVMP